MFFFFFFFFVSFCFGSGFPGAKIAIPESTLQKIADQSIPFVEKMLKNLTFPTIQEKVSTPLGKANIDLRNMKFTSIDIESIATRILEKSVVVGCIPQVNLVMNSEWTASSANRDEDWGYSGTVDITIQGLACVHFSADLSLLTISCIKVSIPEMEVEIESLDFSVHGGPTFLIDIFKGIIEHNVKESLQSEIESNVPSILVPIIQNILDTYSKFPILLPNKSDSLFFSLQAMDLIFNTETNNNYIGFACHGDLEDPSVPLYPVDPVSLPDVIVPLDQMISLYVSQYTFNSVFFVLDELNVLTYTVTEKMIEQHKIPINLTTNFFKWIVPSLYSTYPNQQMQLTLSSNSKNPPQINFSPNKESVEFILNFDSIFQVINTSSSSTTTMIIDAFTIDTKIGTNCSIEIKEEEQEEEEEEGSNNNNNNTKKKEVIALQMFYESFSMELSQTKIGQFSITLLKELLGGVVKKMMFPIINQYLKDKPIELPQNLPYITFESTKLIFHQNFVEIKTDLNFKPS